MAHRPVTGINSKVAKRNTRFSPKISRGNTLTEREEHAHVRISYFWKKPRLITMAGT